jgi:hypothetical protein
LLRSGTGVVVMHLRDKKVVDCLCARFRAPLLPLKTKINQNPIASILGYLSKPITNNDIELIASND